MLNVYNEDYERIGFIESYSYLSWVRRYSEVGEFELKCAPENLPLLTLGNILAKINDSEGAIIETILVESVEQEIITVRGRFLSALLENRIIWNTENLQGDISGCVGQLIENNATNPVDAGRAIPNLKLNHPSVKRILQNKRYLGDKYYPTIIDQETFERAEAERFKRQRKFGRIFPDKPVEECRPATKFIMPKAGKIFNDPFKQAEYAYSLIESEVEK